MQKDKKDGIKPRTLESLFPEVKCLIFDQLDQLEDIICFGVTNKSFWDLSRKRFHDYFMSLRGQLAGKNLVHLESDGGVDDTPPGLFTSAELEALSRVPEENKDNVLPPNPMAIKHDSFTELNPGQISKISSNALEACKARDPNEPNFERVRSQVICDDFSYLPKYQQWVLRNLTTKEYVRAEDIAIKPELIQGPYIGALGFGSIIAARTCWTKATAINIQVRESKLSLHNGPWAGHAFEIIPWSSHLGRADFDEWKDASIEVNKDLDVIGEDALGPDWRAVLCNMWETEMHSNNGDEEPGLWPLYLL